MNMKRRYFLTRSQSGKYKSTVHFMEPNLPLLNVAYVVSNCRLNAPKGSDPTRTNPESLWQNLISLATFKVRVEQNMQKIML
jgi:hypothetical protein